MCALGSAESLISFERTSQRKRKLRKLRDQCLRVLGSMIGQRMADDII